MASDLSDGKKTPKFVPSRLKNKCKFYMRGDMLKIRESIDNEAWKKYAEKKFDLKAEPFLVVCENLENPNEMTAEARDTESSIVHGGAETSGKIEALKHEDLVNKLASMFVSQPSYSREEMLKINEQHDQQYWQRYAVKTWNTKEEPFEMDKELHCPFEQRLRILRERERQARKKIIEMRKEPAEVTWDDIKNRYIAEHSSKTKVSSALMKQQAEIEQKSANYWAKKAEEWIQRSDNTEDKEWLCEQDSDFNLMKKKVSEDYDPSKLFQVLKAADTRREKILSNKKEENVYKAPCLENRLPEEQRDSSFSLANDKAKTYKKKLQRPNDLISRPLPSHSTDWQNFSNSLAYNLYFAQAMHAYTTTSCYLK